MRPFATPLPFELLRKIGLRRREDRRKAVHNFKIVLLLFLSLVGYAVHQVYAGRKILSLNQTGVHTQAKLIHLESPVADDSDYQLDYEMYAPQRGVLGAPMKKLTGTFFLAPSVAKDLHEGQSLEVVYPAGHPERVMPVLATRTAFSGVGWIVFFAAMAFLLLVLSALSQLVKSCLSVVFH